MITRSAIRTPAILIAFGLTSILAACSGAPPVDPYADPGTAPPPTITDPTIATSGSVSPRAGSDLVDVNVAGFLTATTEGVTTLSTPVLDASDFVVVEDGVVKGITVERIGTDGTRAPADIAFVFDTTGSMGSALSSVQDSIIEFVGFLDAGGLDVRVGAVTFGDAFDTMSEASTRTGESISGLTPPSFDTSERPSFQLSDDFDAFRDFIVEDSPRGGGDGPENAVGALEFAYDNMSWRPGAQRIMIVIMDVYSHNDETFTFAGGEDWMPPNPDDLLDRLRGNATVHVIAPDFTFDVAPHTDMAMFAGVSGTGGVFSPWSFGDFDLTELPLAAATAGGYVVTYRGTRDGSEHIVRVVIDDGGDVRGEFTLESTY